MVGQHIGYMVVKYGLVICSWPNYLSYERKFGGISAICWSYKHFKSF